MKEFVNKVTFISLMGRKNTTRERGVGGRCLAQPGGEWFSGEVQLLKEQENQCAAKLRRRGWNKYIRGESKIQFYHEDEEVQLCLLH